MTQNQQSKIITTLKRFNYSEFHANMWCKSVGHITFCFCFETMTLYWLYKNHMDTGKKIRYNINTEKFSELIREYEHTVLTITK